MRRIGLFLAVMAAVLTSTASPAALTENLILSKNTGVFKAGELLKTKLIFKCSDGVKLGSYQAYVLRKNAPKEFFAQPGIAIHYYDKKTRKINDYDTIFFTDSKNFRTHLASGECDIVINTAGMPAGDYAVIVQVWLRKNNKSYYRGVPFYLTITEGDNKKFVKTIQTLPAAAMKVPAATPTWYKKFTVTPSEISGAPGSKYVISSDFTAGDRYYFGGYCVFAMRMYSPKEFFERTGAKVKFVGKDKAKKIPSQYDQIAVVPFKHMPSVVDQKLNFEIDTAGFTPGKYKLCFEIRLVDRTSGKTSYPFITLPLTVK